MEWAFLLQAFTTASVSQANEKDTLRTEGRTDYLPYWLVSLKLILMTNKSI